MPERIDVQLFKLRRRMIKMCSLVDDQVESALKAVTTEDNELAEKVIRLDLKVDTYDLKISKACQKIFALNHPLAADLRFLMSALTINNNLERIGDIAVNLCENFLLKGRKPSFFERIKFLDMARIVREMIQNSIDSFIRLDLSLAKKVIVADKALDRINVENHRLIIDIMKEDRDSIDEAVAYMVMCRQLERIGDHATNIAEDVYFIVEARTVRHNYSEFFEGDSSNGPGSTEEG